MVVNGEVTRYGLSEPITIWGEMKFWNLFEECFGKRRSWKLCKASSIRDRHFFRARRSIPPILIVVTKVEGKVVMGDPPMSGEILIIGETRAMEGEDEVVG